MEDNKNKIWWKPAVEIFSEVSTWIAIPIVLALVIGKMLDKHYNTKPIFLLILAGIGFLFSSYGIVKSVKKYSEKLKKEEKNNLNNLK